MKGGLFDYPSHWTVNPKPECLCDPCPFAGDDDDMTDAGDLTEQATHLRSWEID